MFATTNETSIQLDQAQITQHLAALGYKKGDTVYLRGFYPNTDPRSKEKGSARKAQTKSSGELIRVATQWQEDGMGIYFVVNGGGHKDEDVKQCRAIFFEHDNMPKELQLTLWKELGLPEPTLQTDTGNKSIHSKWVLEEFCEPAPWKELQTDLLEYSDGDRSLKNPSRVMRLAGCYHISENGLNLTRIISNSGKKYSYEELRSIIPQPKSKPESKPKIDYTPQTGDVPLSACLSKSDRELIDGGVSEGGRNSNGAKLARNLIGTASRLQYLGIPFSEHPRELFDLYCQRCSPSIDDKEADSIYRKAELANPTATLTDDALENCMNAWKHNQTKSTGRSFGTSNYNKKSSSNGGGDDGTLLQEIDKLIEQAPSLAELHDRIIKIAAAQKSRDVKSIWNLYETRLKEVEQKENIPLTEKSVKHILRGDTLSIDLAKIFPPDLAKPINEIASILNLRPECYATGIISVVSSLQVVGTKVLLYEPTDYTVGPNFFGAIVAPPSQKKSPIFQAVLTKPLKPLKKNSEEKHREELAEYQRNTEMVNAENESNNKQKSDLPEKPTKRLYSFTKATGEGLRKQAESRPNDILLWAVDEISGLFKSSNAYRNGRGSDEEDILSYYDGGGETVLRADGVRNDVDDINLSIFGGIQPQVAEKLINTNDSNGKWGRFAFVIQPVVPSYLIPGIPKIDITPMLTSLYEKIDKLPATDYYLSKEAGEYFIDLYNELEENRVDEPQPGMQSYWGKTAGRIGKLALNLHVIKYAFEGEFPPYEISIETLEAAKELAKFYICQVRALYTQISDPNALAPNLAKIIALAERKEEPISRKDVYGNWADTKNKPTSTQVGEWFQQLAEMGMGELIGQGRSQKFEYIAKG